EVGWGVEPSLMGVYSGGYGRAGAAGERKRERICAAASLRGEARDRSADAGRVSIRLAPSPSLSLREHPVQKRRDRLRGDRVRLLIRVRVEDADDQTARAAGLEDRPEIQRGDVLVA